MCAISSPSGSTTPTTPPKPACRSRRSRSSSTRRRPASAGRTTTPSSRRTSTKLDYEVELGIVIGKRARYLTKDKAMDAVAGYCLANDVSERAFQIGARADHLTRARARDLRPARALVRHQGRDQGPAEPRDVARRQRREAPARQHQDHDLRCRAYRLVLLAILRAGAGRRDRHRHAAGRRPRHEAGAGVSARPATWSNSASTGSARRGRRSCRSRRNDARDRSRCRNASLSGRSARASSTFR